MMAARDRVMGVQQKMEDMEAETESKKEADMNRDRMEQLSRTIQLLVEKVNKMEKRSEA